MSQVSDLFNVYDLEQLKANDKVYRLMTKMRTFRI